VRTFDGVRCEFSSPPGFVKQFRIVFALLVALSSGGLATDVLTNRGDIARTGHLLPPMIIGSNLNIQHTIIGCVEDFRLDPFWIPKVVLGH
jgi:hypothetical protein